MDINKKNRSDLKSYFVKNSIPTESNFSDLIDGMLNQKDDGIVKQSGDPLSIEAAGDLTGLQKVLNFYGKLVDANPAWSLQLNPRANLTDAATSKPGLCIADGQSTPRLFIEQSTGNIGIATIAPKAKLDINGNLSVTGNIASTGTLTVTGAAVLSSNLTVNAAIYAGNSDIYFTKTDHNYSGINNDGQDAIENALNFGALMILGRKISNLRTVKLWDYLQVNGRLDVTGATALSSTLGVTGATTLTGATIISSTLAVTGATTLTGATILSSTLGVTGATTLTGATILSSTLGVTGATTLTGAATLSSTLGVTGATTLTGATILSSTLGVTGATTLTGATILSSTLGVTGATTLTGATILSSTLGVTGATTLTGAATLSSTLAVTGATTLSSTLAVAGNVGIGIGTTTPIAKLDIAQATRTGTTHSTTVKGLYVTGDFDAANGVEFRLTNGTQGIGFGYNTIYATGSNTDQNLNLKVKGTGTVTVTGATTLSSTLAVAGAITPSAGNTETNGIMFPKDPGGGGLDAAWIRYYARTGESCTLEIGITNDADDHIALIPSGNVGIGTTSPTKAKLEIAGTSNYTMPIFDYLTYQNLVQRGTAGGYALSLYASDKIAAAMLLVFSDERIKISLGRSDNSTDLQTLLGIEITDYRYKDVISKGDAPHKKVIAQQVEQVYPQAVSKHTDVVPDIYQPASIIDGWVELATDLQPGERVRLICDKTEGVFDVLEVTKDKFRADFKPNGDQVFVFGREVNDFCNVDYDAIAMLNVSATQQLKKEIDALKAVNVDLNVRLAVLEAKI